MPGKKLIAAGVAVACLAGYATADAFDVVPGVLTTAAPNEVRPTKVGPEAFTPLQPASPVAFRAPERGAAPSAASVKKALDDALKNKWWGSTVAVSVRDGESGSVLAEHDSNKATTPASITKLLTAYAIAHSKLPLTERLTTRATVSGNTVELVAGGDMVLGKGQGDATQIAGYAGLGDLARQAAEKLKQRGITRVTVNSNTAYAPGPDKGVGWTDDMLRAGFAARISTLALADDRFDDHSPAAADPTKNATNAFVAALKKQGINATYGKNMTSTPVGDQVAAVESATVLDILGLALQDSDNSMIESLARQAAALDGVHGDSAKVGGWVRDTVQKQGIDVSGVSLRDTSGLSDGTKLPVRVLGEILSRGTSGKDPAYADVLSRLPVSAWNGTLHNRFWRDDSKSAAGIVWAKTGSLMQVSSLAGVVVTKSGHELTFAVTTNNDFPEGPDGAKGAIDALVAKLGAL